MKQLAIAVALLASISVCAGQDDAKKKDAPAPPEISQALQVKILHAQNDQLQLQATANQYQQQLTQLSNQFAADAKELQSDEDEAYAEAKLSKDDYTIDPKTLKFVAKPKPVTPTPAAQEKK